MLPHERHSPSSKATKKGDSIIPPKNIIVIVLNLY